MLHNGTHNEKIAKQDMKNYLMVMDNIAMF